jgi:hypothetical protein
MTTNRTMPSGQPGGVPSGPLALSRPNDDEPTKRGLLRENESAKIIASAGYKIEQKPTPPLGSGKNPDYLIEGRIFDCYAPETANAYNIVDTIAVKVGKGQTNRIILNLDDSTVSIEKIRNQLTSTVIPGLEEIFIIKNNQLFPFFP